MADYNNALYTYEKVADGIGYFKKDDQLRYSEDFHDIEESIPLVQELTL